MFTSLIYEDELVTVAVAQTTFTVLTTSKARFRIDFIDKAEAYLKPGMRGNLKSYLEHPLLLNYNWSLISVYINSKPQDPEELNGEIRRRVEAHLQGWRDFSIVLYPQALKQNLIDGNGILLQAAPVPIAQAVIDACAEQGVATWATPPYGHPQNKPAFRLLLIGKGYVIAKDFRIVELSKETLRLLGQ